MKVLVVFLLAVLSCSPAQGRIVPKCELKEQLVNAIGNMTEKENELIGEDLVVKFVCYVELVSNFDTSAVRHGGNSNPHRLRRAAVATTSTTHPQTHSTTPSKPVPTTTRPPPPQNTTHIKSTPSNAKPPTPQTTTHIKSTPSTAKPPQSTTKPINIQSTPGTGSTKPVSPTGHTPTTRATVPPQTTGVAQSTPSTKPSSSNQHTARARRSLDSQDVTYGLFQLSNHLACSDNTSSSPNICGLDCSNLVDDNIQDDITCFLRILTNVEAIVGVDPFELKQMFKLIFKDQCREKKASVYFAECS
ncbi:uncharacterized protein [Channa argus]|uniref:uncharacterized protein n=1 Tax=Channa argus TaxID=215402 RepID=UPI00294860BF|nr:hypothetical protein Q8A73_002878 [Channa argus]